MKPLFFGAAEAPLYGVYHPARADAPAQAHGVVLCPAFGQEYMRAHRAYRQLAMLLTRRGFHVLRFDYLGTGDSSGDLSGVTAGDWLADIAHAVDELRELARVGPVSLVGLRLGALLAANACAHCEGLERLVLWDPVADGAAYEAELREAIASEAPSEYEAPSGNGEDAAGVLHCNGFGMPPPLRASLRLLDLAAAATASVARVLHVVSHESDASRRCRDRLRAHPGLRYQHTPAPHDWNYVDNFGGILLPQPVIQAVVQWMEGA